MGTTTLPLAPGRLAVARGLLVTWVIAGAILSFSMEPLVGRMVLPKYGGSAHVWNVSMMVFQGLLLLGYAYAHGPGRRLGRWHVVVLLAPLLWLPIRFGGPSAPDAPIRVLTGELLLYVGVPFCVLTTTSVIAQVWWSRSPLGRRQEPYALYAASNIGSLVALLGYALVAEPLSGLATQSWVWSAGYVAYLLVGAVTWWWLQRPVSEPADLLQKSPAVTTTPPPSASQRPTTAGLAGADVEAATPAPSAVGTDANEKRAWGASGKRRVAMWLVLAAVPSVLLLATTNKVATEVGSFPLVWVIPLALYLGSFVVVFRPTSRVDRLIDYWPEFLLLMATASVGIHLVSFLLAFLGFFFIACVVFHRELYLLRPPAESLTAFYLTMALGGWIGGVVVAVGAPLVFNDLYELPLGLILGACALALVRGRQAVDWWRVRPRRLRAARLVLVVVVAMAAGVVAHGIGSVHHIATRRSFYGVYRVRAGEAAEGPFRVLTSGATVHGVQYLDEPLRHRPTSYYHSGGPIDQAMALRPAKARMAVIGLGAGVVAADVNPGESMVFYEIDPVNPALARKWFTYLDDARGDVSVRIGDARILMESEADRGSYDSILVDAFSGDGVPVHLLTREAIEVYLHRLNPHGILIFHISNRYSDLRGVLKAEANALDLAGAYRIGRAEDAKELDAEARVVALSPDPAALAPLLAQDWRLMGPGDGIGATRLWTDDYVNVLDAMWRAFRGWPGERTDG